MPIDLEFAEALINRPHIIDLRVDGWTIMHPPACHPNLFDCSVNLAAGEQIDGPLDFQGRYYCGLDDLGQFYVGDAADATVGVDWNALVAELRTARDCVDALRTIVSDDRTYYAQLHHQHYAEQTLELYDKAAEEARS